MTKRRHFERDVTREQAVEWLKRVDDRQRPMSKTHAGRFAIDINAGDWHDAVAHIAFDTKGKLINGQHVLNGLLLSKRKSLRVLVSLNYAPEAYAGFDKNRKRSAADDLKVMGVERSSEVASVLVALWKHEKGIFKGTNYLYGRGGAEFPTAAESIEAYRKHPGIQEHLFKNPFKGKGPAIGAMRAGSYILHQIDEKRAKKFFTSLIEGTEIPTRDHPIGVLRDVFIHLDEKDSGPRAKPGLTLAYIFKAWLYYIRGQVVPPGPLLRKNEPFPEVMALPAVQPITKSTAS